MDSLLELHKAALDVAVSQRFQGRHRSIEDAFTDLKTKHSKIDFEDVDYRRAFECVGQMLETAVPCIQSQPVTDRPRDPTDGMPDLDDLIPRLRSSVAGYDDYIYRRCLRLTFFWLILRLSRCLGTTGYNSWRALLKHEIRKSKLQSRVCHRWPWLSAGSSRHRCAMTLIEVHVNEDYSELEQLVRDAYSSIGYPQTLPSFRFGRVIIWEGRMFQQVEISIEYEDLIFRLGNLPANRTRVQVGSTRGEVFTTPPEAECEPAARIKEGGRCGREYLVRPFYCSDYDRVA